MSRFEVLRKNCFFLLINFSRLSCFCIRECEDSIFYSGKSLLSISSVKVPIFFFSRIELNFYVWSSIVLHFTWGLLFWALVSWYLFLIFYCTVFLKTLGSPQLNLLSSRYWWTLVDEVLHFLLSCFEARSIKFKIYCWCIPIKKFSLYQPIVEISAEISFISSFNPLF